MALLVVASMLFGNVALAYGGVAASTGENGRDLTNRSTTGRDAQALPNSELQELVERFDRTGVLDSAGIVRGDRVLVLIEHELPTTMADGVLNSVGATRRTHLGSSFVEAYVPISRLQALQDQPGVRYVKPAPEVSPPHGQVSAAISLSVTGGEAAKTGADAWHSAGFDGAGVKIGIIDDFDPTVWNEAQTNGDVPAPAGTVCVEAGFSCNLWAVTPGETHGVAIAEIVHEMAPGATLYLGSGITLGDLMSVIDYFAAQGVQVINYSATFPYDGPGDGTGPAAAVVDYAVSKGIAWVNSAGNFAGGSYWRGTWTDTDSDGWLEFPGGFEEMFIDCGWALGLRWDDWAVANPTDYDVSVWDTLTGAFVTEKAGSADDQTAGAPPLENFGVPLESAGCAPGEQDLISVRLIAEGDGASGDTLEIGMAKGLEFPSDPYSAAVPFGDTVNPGAISVGAVDPPNGTSVASYSSRGPTNDGRIKPDLSAPAGMTTFSAGTFSGTSGAAPVVAGAAALLLDAGLVANPTQLKTYLLSSAVADRGTKGPDNDFGAGELYLGEPPHRSPVGVDDAYEATEDTQLVVSVSAGVLFNDTDPDGDSLTVSVSDTVSAEGGTVAVAADGSFTYAPPTDFTGTDTFGYTVSDGDLTDTAIVTITVSPPPPPGGGGGGGGSGGGVGAAVLQVPIVTCPESLSDSPFADLDGYSAETVNAITCLVAYEVSLGTSPTTFSPDVPVTRWQMALFLARQIGTHGVTLPPAAEQGFTDILGLPSATQDAINRLGTLGITKGTTQTTFDPNGIVSRWQMALFLTRVAFLVEIPLSSSAANHFLDIGGYSPETRTAINQLADAGIAKGTSQTTFDPAADVLRWQMALFLTRSLQAGGVTLE
ncbi:MAG: S8 family serine peptidase [Acidimicrobiia bacterium]|nr:S8 family serine peptidase [Acidimicrobiia bacterium]